MRFDVSTYFKILGVGHSCLFSVWRFRPDQSPTTAAATCSSRSARCATAWTAKAIRPSKLLTLPIPRCRRP